MVHVGTMCTFFPVAHLVVDTRYTCTALESAHICLIVVDRAVETHGGGAHSFYFFLVFECSIIDDYKIY